MVYTVTLNPSIDYVVRLNSLNTGVTNRTQSEEYRVGGKGLNVSTVLAELGVDSTALGFVAGFTGDVIEKQIENDRITADFIRLKNGISRINLKIKTHEETEINAQGPMIESDELEALLKKLDEILDGDTLVLAGSIPNTMPDDVYVKILERIEDKNVCVIVDAAKKLLLSSLEFKPFLIKPNRQELSELFGVEIKTEKDVEFYAGKLQKMGAKNVLVSLDCEGAFLLDEFGKKHWADAEKGKTVNTVGCGDSMVAGFVAGYQERKDYQYALKLGSACAAATAFSNGLAQNIEKNITAEP